MRDIKMNVLFKGYVPTKNKKCLIPFKDCMEFNRVKNLPEYAGILAEDIILIDIDDYEQSEILMSIVEDLQLRCRVYETTRGKHFLFKNHICDKGGTHIKLACGLESDVKVGKKNSYSVIKYSDKERPIIYDIFDDEEYEEVPKWLLPIKTNMDFIAMKSGDGRNQALFNYILTLQANDFSNDEAKETIRIINEYVLKDKLDDSEIETILRDDAFAKPVFFKKNVFLFDKFAIYLKNNNHIIKINNQLHVYRDGIYVNGATEIEAEMIRHIPNLNRAKRAEVTSYMDLLVRENTEMSDAHYIAFNNGVYDLLTGELGEFSPSKVITNKIPWDYVPDAYSEITDKTLNKMACNDDSIRALLEEAIGYCFYRRNELRKCFILIGEKQNGKSTYLSMIEHLLGGQNISSLDMKELGDRFKTAELFGKLANIGDDIEDEFIPNPAILKKLVSGNPVNAERKGANPFDFANYSKLLFSANNIPRIKDKSGAVMSRLIIVPFNARFTADDPDFDPHIKYKLIQQEPMEYLINLGIKGLQRILTNRKFTTSQKVEEQLQEYEENNHPILLFFKEDVKIENEPTSNVYLKYKEFCIANNFNPMSNIEFSKQVKRHFNLDIIDKKISGKKYRIFVKKGD